MHCWANLPASGRGTPLGTPRRRPTESPGLELHVGRDDFGEVSQAQCVPQLGCRPLRSQRGDGVRWGLQRPGFGPSQVPLVEPLEDLLAGAEHAGRAQGRAWPRSPGVGRARGCGASGQGLEGCPGGCRALLLLLLMLLTREGLPEVARLGPSGSAFIVCGDLRWKCEVSLRE